jgi:Rrf2 family protein
MRMNEGVEWAIHTCLNLSWVEADRAVPAAKLAAYFDLPTAYLNKQLQALARVGIVSSVPGPRGGFRLVRPPDKVTLLDVVVAIDGPDPAFRCTQILRNSPGGDPDGDYRRNCLISRSMHTAEMAWRRELTARTLGDIRTELLEHHPDIGERTRKALI